MPPGPPAPPERAEPPPSPDAPERAFAGVSAGVEPPGASVLSAAFIGTSATTSPAGLSSRSPLKLGWRMPPSRVHSVNSTSATSSGRTQCTVFWAFSRPAVKAGASNRRSCSRAASAVSDFSSKPVPTLPTYRSPPSSRTPSSRAPKPVRAPAGSVYPPMTNSCWFLHLVLTHSPVRAPARYGLPARLLTIPSSSMPHACSRTFSPLPLMCSE